MNTHRALFWILLVFIMLPLAAFTQTTTPANQPATASPAAPSGNAQTTSGNNPPAASSGTAATPSVQSAPNGKQEAGPVTPAPVGSAAPTDGTVTTNIPLIAEASPLNFKMSPDGTVATVLFDKESVEAMKTVIAQLEQSGTLGKVKGIIYSSAGITPMLVLMGEKNELAQKLEILRQFIPDQNQAHIVVISASLRELADEDAYNIGLTLSPDIIGMKLGGLSSATFQYDKSDDYYATARATLDDTDFGKIAQFNEAYNKGKVLVASEVYTRNGTKALLTNLQQIPIFSTDRYGNVMTQYQALETSIDVIPTTVEYKKDTPKESQVRVDVLVKISVVTGTSTYSASTSAPTYATKTFATTRVLKANNERYVVGTFVTDAVYRQQVGLPFLSKIPFLKYLFSREGDTNKRNIAILTLAVRLVPMQVKDLTIDAETIDPLEELYKRKGSLKDAK